MERQHVITILEALANGTDPATRAPIPLDTFHSADTVRAMFTAVALLKEGEPGALPSRRTKRATSLTSAGAPWSPEEDARLGAEFDSGMTVSQIALQHGRSSGAITSRLVKLGRIDAATVKTRERGARLASQDA